MASGFVILQGKPQKKKGHKWARGMPKKTDTQLNFLLPLLANPDSLTNDHPSVKLR